MRRIFASLTALTLLFLTSSNALAFGRGAPPHGGGGHGGGGHGGGGHVGGGAHFSGGHIGGGGVHVGGGEHGAFAGPLGSAHGIGRIPAGTGGERAINPGFRGGEIGRPGGEIGRPGGEIGRSGGEIGRPGGEIGRPGGGGSGFAGGGIGGYGIRAGHSTQFIRPSTLQALGQNIGGREYPYFTRDWFGRHGGAWFPGAWAGGLGLWDVPYWDGLAPFIGIDQPPMLYDYGSNAVIMGDSLYYNGEPLATVADFADQAIAFADAGRAAAVGQSDEWEPLGVFGLLQNINDTNPLRIFQLAVNKAGIVRGNYYDVLQDSNQPVYGEVDRKSQRVVWSVGDRKDIVYDAGLNNLLQNQTTILIHYGKQRTEEMILVRLPPPQLPPPQQQPQQPPR